MLRAANPRERQHADDEAPPEAETARIAANATMIQSSPVTRHVLPLP